MKKNTETSGASLPRMVPLKVWAADNCVSYMTAYRAVRAGQIPGAVKLRSQWRVPRDSATTA